MIDKYNRNVAFETYSSREAEARNRALELSNADNVQRLEADRVPNADVRLFIAKRTINYFKNHFLTNLWICQQCRQPVTEHFCSALERA